MHTILDRLPKTSIPDSYERLISVYAPRPLHDKRDYANACEIVDWLSGHEELNKDQEDYLDAVSTFVHKFEETHLEYSPMPSGLESLKFVMEQNSMGGTDLANILGCHQSVASRILSGDRRLKPEELKILADRFKVSIELFV